MKFIVIISLLVFSLSLSAQDDEMVYLLFENSGKNAKEIRGKSVEFRVYVGHIDKNKGSDKLSEGLSNYATFYSVEGPQQLSALEVKTLESKGLIKSILHDRISSTLMWMLEKNEDDTYSQWKVILMSNE